MSNAELELIAAVIHAAEDPTRRAAILAATKPNAARKRPGTIRDAAAILGVCTKTVERYTAEGKLHRICLSPRKIRYDLNEVSELAENGI
jgi:hypothetical protein